MRDEQTQRKRELRRVQSRFDTMYGVALLGFKGLLEMSSLQSQAHWRVPEEIRAHEIALEFLKAGRFDRIERKFYCLDQLPPPNHIIVLESDPNLVPQGIDRAGNLWGKRRQQWAAIKQAMQLADWTDPTYASHGWRWSRDEYRNSDNPFLRWVYRTSTNCEIVDFKNSSTVKSSKRLKWCVVYV